jgi:hypothetical protein
MRRPTDAYREGYEKGQADNIALNVTEAMFGLLRDDPDGHFAAGYHDGVGGKKFNPPPDKVRKADADHNPFDDKVAIKTVCPNCGELDWFEWNFLGKLNDPFCDYTWYASSGTYVLMQFLAAFQAGRKFSKYLNSGISRGEGAWIAKVLGWSTGILLGISIRLEFGLLMTPIQAIIGLCQSRKSKTEVISRSIAVVVSVSALAVIAYVLQQSSKVQAGPTPLPSITQPSASQMAQSVPIPQKPDILPHTFTETFRNAPDHNDNWVVAWQTGSPTVTYTPSNFRVQALPVCPGPSSGTSIGFRTRQSFVGDIDVSFQLNHGGYGRTQVGLWSASKNQSIVVADLDTNDTAFLNFSSGTFSTQFKYSSAPYMNVWITLRIQIVGSQVHFYVDNGSGQQLVQTWPIPVSSSGEAYYLFFAAGSVCWKSGFNDTSFRLVTAEQ